MQGEFNDPLAYQKLAQLLAKTDELQHTGRNYLFYLATPPQVFATIVQHLGESGLAREEDGFWRRVIIEKPFGVDLRSAQALNNQILRVLNENQIYRIDHYLGKETVQNIMVFRFANGFFEPLWNRNYIDHVQITDCRNSRCRAPRQVLRSNRRVARHGAEPPVPASDARCDGAADLLRGRRRARREAQGAGRRA